MTEQIKDLPTNDPAEKDSEPTTAQEPNTADNDLNINDLNAMKQIIDLASSRGAFKANEMVAIGTVYNKLSNFLSQVAAKQGQ